MGQCHSSMKEDIPSNNTLFKKNIPICQGPLCPEGGEDNAKSALGLGEPYSSG